MGEQIVVTRQEAEAALKERLQSPKVFGCFFGNRPACDEDDEENEAACRLCIRLTRLAGGEDDR